MVAAWYRGLEHLLGHPVTDGLPASALQRLVEEQVAENDQLDFKVDRYGIDDKGRGELAKDVCAFANRLGGVLVIGVAEAKGVASKLRPLQKVGDADKRHVRSVVASWCTPVPDLDVIVVPDDDDTSGYLVISVPPSSRAPHAVSPPGDPSFRWPVRRGSGAGWLSESELADAYRARASRIAEEANRLDLQLSDAVKVLDPESLWLVTALVPSPLRPGPPVDHSLLSHYQQWLRTQPLWGMRGAPIATADQIIAGPRRAVFFDYRTKRPYRSALGLYAELHTDGSGVLAQQLRQPREMMTFASDIEDGTRIVLDEHLAELVTSSVQILAKHALDNGGAWGEASMAAMLTDGGQESLARPLALAHPRSMGMLDVFGSTRRLEGPAPRAGVTIDIAAAANHTADALVAARLLGGDLVNHFGLPELLQLTPEGQIRLRYISQGSRSDLKKWASHHNVAITDEPVPD